MGAERNVHLAFGFHVNCYHSYRGDTNDALGFGGDIRIIRHIINVLDKANQDGVPVKGTWDFENAYSLEEILPKYAPDIIENVKRRQNENGDENILMGYNNGALSAMTEEEFAASINLAIRNEKKSGLEDIFGSCERIIRPQEVMFTPSETALYEKAGIKAVCLYYSCIPFDAFRTVIPQLPDRDAFNPLTYTYQNHSVTILPTYSHSDIMDAGSLRWWVTDLHERQKSGEIDTDVFLFINIDADSFLWEPLNAPKFIQKMPCGSGLQGLIDETKDLPFIVYDTPGGYLKEHESVREIFFGEDVADGNLSGYASWAEKPFNRQIWTRLERARTYANAADQEKREGAGFDERVRLLSTTHFGLASPVMNIVREEKALALSDEMQNKDCKTDAQGVATNGNLNARVPITPVKEGDNYIAFLLKENSQILSAELTLDPKTCDDVTRMEITAENDTLNYTLIPMEYYDDGYLKTVYLIGRVGSAAQNRAVKININFRKDSNSEVREPSDGVDYGLPEVLLRTGKMRMRLSGTTGFPVFYEGDEFFAEWNSWIEYDGRKYVFDRPTVAPLVLGGEGKGIRLSGEIHLPNEISKGTYLFDFVASEVITGYFVYSDVTYPYTLEDHEISSQASNLGRYSDVKWQQTAPMELTLHENDAVTVYKRNFMDDISSFPLSDFWTAFPENKTMAAFNHQLTGGILAVDDGKGGLVLAHSRQVLSSMAHCPMKLFSRNADLLIPQYHRGKSSHEERRNRIVSLNPFGHYFGRQRYYPTRGNGCVMVVYNMTMPQARSIAPAYNGAREQAVQLITSSAIFRNEEETVKFGGDEQKNGSCIREMTAEKQAILNDIKAFSDGAVRIAESGKVRVFMDDNVSLREAVKKEEDAAKLKAVAKDGRNLGETWQVIKEFRANMKAAKKKLKMAEARVLLFLLVILSVPLLPNAKTTVTAAGSVVAPEGTLKQGDIAISVLADENDEDYYYFRVKQNVKVTVNFEKIDQDKKGQWSLYVGRVNVDQEQRVYRGNGGEKASFFLKKGKYYFRVAGNAKTASRAYRLSYQANAHEIKSTPKIAAVTMTYHKKNGETPYITLKSVDLSATCKQFDGYEIRVSKKATMKGKLYSDMTTTKKKTLTNWSDTGFQNRAAYYVQIRGYKTDVLGRKWYGTASNVFVKENPFGK